MPDYPHLVQIGKIRTLPQEVIIQGKRLNITTRHGITGSTGASHFPEQRFIQVQAGGCQGFVHDIISFTKASICALVRVSVTQRR